MVGSVVWLHMHQPTNQQQIIRSLLMVIKPKHVGAVLI